MRLAMRSVLRRIRADLIDFCAGSVKHRLVFYRDEPLSAWRIFFDALAESSGIFAPKSLLNRFGLRRRRWLLGPLVRRTSPFADRWKRFLAPLCVFIFGMVFPLCHMAEMQRGLCYLCHLRQWLRVGAETVGAVAIDRSVLADLVAVRLL